MTDSKKQTEMPSTSPEPQKDTRQLIIFLAILVLAIIWGIQHPSTALRIAAVLLGFGGIIMIHEFGHFIVAKLGGIKVEAFSIGMPPVVLGFRKRKKGWRVRVLPKIGEPEQLERIFSDSRLVFDLRREREGITWASAVKKLEGGEPG